MRNFVNLADIDKNVQQANINDIRMADALYGQKMNQRAMEREDRAYQDQERVRGITREVGGDLKTLRDRLYQEGYLDQGAAIDKQMGEQEKTSLGNEKTRIENAKTRIGIFGSGANFIAQNPTKENAMMVFQNMLNAKVIDENQFQEYTAQIPDDPALIKNGAMALFQQAIDAKDQLETFSTVDTGGQKVTQGVNPVTGAVRQVGALDVTMTPAQIEANKIARGQLGVSQGNLALSREKFNAEQKGGVGGNTKGAPSGYRWTANNELEVIPGGPADVKAGGAVKLTEQQGKSNLFFTRATEADKIISDPKLKFSPLAINAKSAVGKTPLLGGGAEATANLLLSEGSQKAEQAQRDFVNAVLRLESGAVINPEEFDNARKQYFPQPGDTKAVIEQKAKNRKTAIEGLKVMAGPAVTQNPNQTKDARMDDVMSEADRILGLQ